MTDSPPAPATGSFALDLSREGITLYWLSSHAVWNAVDHVVLHEGNVAEPMARLRARIGGQPAPARVDVWLPEDQVIVRLLDSGGAPPTERMVAGLFDDAAEPLEFDAEMRPGAATCTIAAIPRSVLEQTRDFLRPHGFVIDTYTVRHAPAGMDNAPNFPLEPAAPVTAPRRAVPPRAALGAVALVLAGGLLAGVVTGVFGDRAPQTPLVKVDGPAAPDAAGGPGQAPGGAADGDGRVSGANDIRSADRLVAFAEPGQPEAVGRAQIDLPLPAAPEPSEAVGALPRTHAMPPRGASPRLERAAAEPPRAPAIYTRAIQTEVAAPLPPDAAAPPPTAAREWTRFAATLPAEWLIPAAAGGAAPDLSALRDVPQPAVLVLGPAQGRPGADAAQAAAPRPDQGSYVAMLPGELGVPAGAPDAADVAGVRSRPASVAPPIMVALAMPATEADAGASPLPPVAPTRAAAAAAPAPAERSAPQALFALSAPAGRPALSDPGAAQAAPAEEPAPAAAVLDQADAPPRAPARLAGLAAPSGPSTPADLSGARAPASVRLALDWMPVQPAPGALLAPPPELTGESALNAMLIDILAAAPSESGLPRIDATDGQPRARIATAGTRPNDAEPAVVAGLTAAPSPGTAALRPPALAVQPLDLDTPRAADTHDELASLLSPANGVQVGSALSPRQGDARPDSVPLLRAAEDAAAVMPAVSRPAAAATAPAPVELAALGGDLPRARVAPRGTVPELPDIEFAALDRSMAAADGRPDSAARPAMAAPSAAPAAVPVPLPALPPASDGTGVEVAVIDASPDIVPPLRPRPQVIAARPDIVPPLRGTPADAAAQPEAVAEEGVELAALTVPEATDETADDASDLALSSLTRPRPRPASAVVEEPEEVEVAALAPSELALNRSDAPRPRPSDLARPEPAAPAAAAVAAPEPKRAAPPLPTTASVARAATIKNALPFGRMALIGVFGSERNRHAIVRLRSGNFVKVKNGESIDGYQITGMSANAIRLQRGGRETLLVIPQ